MNKKILILGMGGVVVLALLGIILSSSLVSQPQETSNFNDFDSLPEEDQNSILDLLDQELENLDGISIEDLNNTLLIQ